MAHHPVRLLPAAVVRWGLQAPTGRPDPERVQCDGRDRLWKGLHRHGSRLKPVFSALLALLFWLGGASAAVAQLQASPSETGTGLVRSLESLRDLDYQSWQVVAYRDGEAAVAAPVTLRIVSYPGRLRLDHPTSLLVRSGRHLWALPDITLTSAKLAGDNRAAAAEFDLTSLLADLHSNRPLRLELPGVFVELPVPPYVVAEWRSLPLAPLPQSPV